MGMHIREIYRGKWYVRIRYRNIRVTKAVGEATAHQWHDLDFGKNYILVRRNIAHHHQVKTTKTEASQRRIDMSPELGAELKHPRRNQIPVENIFEFGRGHSG